MFEPPPAVLTTLFVLALFAAYLTTGSLVSDRISPIIFFTLSICLAAATFHPTIWVAAASVATSIIAQCFQSIDHIHGECGYGVLWGQRTWHQARLGDLAYYRQCSQPATAFWVMLIIGCLWLGIFVLQVYQQYKSSSKGIRLPMEGGPDGLPSPRRGLDSSDVQAIDPATNETESTSRSEVVNEEV